MDIKAEQIFNKGDKLPFAYQNPETEGKLMWICNNDAEGRITSVFVMDLGDHKDKKCSYLKDMKEAIYARDELLKDGWIEFRPPEITFTMPNGEQKTTLCRKERRFLARQLAREQRKNPFKG